MKAPNYGKRRRGILRRIRKDGHDAILVTGESNVRYLTGFTGDSSWLLLSRDTELLISDTRYQTQIRDECEGLDTHVRDARKTLVAAAAEVLQKSGVVKLAMESEHLSLSQFRKIEDSLKSCELRETSKVVETARELKDAWELQQTAEAIRLAERGIGVICSSLTAQQTERQIAHDLEHTMRQFGATGCAFDPIVGVGPTAALPHAHPGSRQISESPVLLIDWGARTQSGYRSDLTRVFITGRTTSRIRKVYETVLRAQQEAIVAIRPGAECAAIDAIARGIIKDAGFGRYFGHGLGHGIGLDIHEGPRLSPTSEETLQPGMVITVEPGIYLPDRAGVRIEDDVLVTEDGHQVLTSVPREFDDAIVDFLAT